MLLLLKNRNNYNYDIIRDAQTHRSQGDIWGWVVKWWIFGQNFNGCMGGGKCRTRNGSQKWGENTKITIFD